MKKIFLFLLLSAALSGCVTPETENVIRVVKNSIISRECRNIALFPFACAKYSGFQSRRMVDYITSGKAGNPLKTKVVGGDFVVTLPLKSEFAVSKESAVFSGVLSTSLAGQGFAAREEQYTAAGGGDKEALKLSLSLAAVYELRLKYGIDGIIIGNVIFVDDMVVYGQGKLIDAESLQVLKTVTFTYENGEKIGEASRAIAEGFKSK